MPEREKEIMNRLREHYTATQENFSNEIVFLVLQGSQNYNLDYEDSDIDSRAMVVPSFQDIVFNKKPVSHTHILENNEHVDVKDVRTMFLVLRKQNINFVELLFSDFYLINVHYEEEITELFKYREQIARLNPLAAVKTMCGMAMEKQKALCHPYPTIQWKIDKWGYDGKQAHLILRIKNFLKGYLREDSYAEILKNHYNDHELLMKLKKNEFEVKEVKKMVDSWMKIISKFKAKAEGIYLPQENEFAVGWLEEVQYSIMEKAVRREIG